MIYCIIYKFFSLKRTIKGHKTDNKKQPVWAVINKSSYQVILDNCLLPTISKIIIA
nr:MAG TPA: hypothetical protein [Caudoviricetes sp.]